MGQSVEVVTSELRLAADRLSGAGQRLQDGLSSVDLETSNLLGSGWKGEAATAFQKYWDQWHNGAGQVVRALQTMSEALNTAAQNYQATDEQAGGALDSTMQGSGGGGTGGGGAPAPAGSGASGGSGSAATGGEGSRTGGAQQTPDLAQQMNLGQAMQPLSQAAGMPAQLAGQIAGGLMQTGQLAAGAAQQAVQMATQLAQQAEAAADEAEVEAAAEKDDETGKPDAASGEPSAGPAPVETPRESPAKPETPTSREL